MDRTDILLDAIEHPGRYSTQELEQLSSDPEVSESLRILDMTMSALQQLPQPDVDREWQEFKSANRIHKSSSGGFIKRNVAASVTIATLSLACAATGIGVAINEMRSHVDNVPQVEEATSQNPSMSETKESQPDKGTTPMQSETIVYDNKQLETILREMAEYYSVRINYLSDDSKSLRLYFKWNKSSSLEEIVRFLNNFEQINLTLDDNTLTVR